MAACIALGPQNGFGQIFVVNSGNGTLGEYTTSGALINGALISGFDQPTGITSKLRA
jgi:hypothetical protein